MKRLSVVVAALAAVTLSYLPAKAVQPITMDEDGIREMLRHRTPGPVQQRLDDMATGKCSGDDCYDGNPILRREPPLVILEEKKTGEYIIPSRYEHHHGAVHCYHGRHHDGGCDYDSGYDRYIPAERVEMFHQKVGIADRDGYVSEAKSGGRLKGALFGLLGALAFIVNPLIGIAVLAATVTTGMVLGAKAAGDKAEKDPKIFERDQTVRTIIGY